MKSPSEKMLNFNRRNFLRACALTATGIAAGGLSGCVSTGLSGKRGSAALTMALDQDWLFGGKFSEGADQFSFNDAHFANVSLPHCVAKLSWENWKPEDWQDVWIYRRHFQLPETFRGQRIFVDFDRVMNHAIPTINGHPLPEHLGGYLPFSYEITSQLHDGDNVLAVTVNSRWQNIPPDGNPKGTQSVDYLEPGGIPGGVTLRAVPQLFISEVFAKPVNVLTANRSVEVLCSIDAAALSKNNAVVRVEMLDGHKRIATVSTPANLTRVGANEIKLTLTNLGDVKLWDVDAPHLYGIVTTLLVDNAPVHEHRTRIGLREARFEVEGFFLNGKKLRLFGLDRHEIYPYVGLAMPDRVMRRDAHILKHEFNCNIVRCSHYPQTEAFLDACDELGLMIWEETPGWGYLGEDPWKEQVVQNVHDMIIRDRNHAAIVIWGVRVNESRNDQPLYERTTALARTLDGTRATSGSMTGGSRKNWEKEWHQDVFAYDDYHNDKDGSVGIDAPVKGVPYMLAEAVGQFSYGKKGFQNKYRRAGDLELQMSQAVFHAQAHNKAANYKNFCGVIAWCGFDYSSLMNCYNAIKCPGVADVFRIPKLGASFYQAQVSPKVNPIIKLSFYWDFGPKSPRGPGKHAAIFSNCDRLEIFVAGKSLTTLEPDRQNYPHLEYPPFFCDLDLDGAGSPELRIDGYVSGKLALSRKFSSDRSHDQFTLMTDDAKIKADGSDATRVTFAVTDQFGEPRAFANGKVTFELSGPGMIVGDNPFDLEDSGGVGAIWIKGQRKNRGTIMVTANHSFLGKKMVTLNVS